MIIGITGWFASGKDTVAEYLVAQGFKSVSLSDIIREHLRAENKELSRENLQKKGNELREKFGPGYLAAEAMKRVDADQSDFVIPAVRTLAELNVLKKNPNFSLWEIYAKPEIRFQRLIKRARTEDEKKLSFEQFLANEEKEKSHDPNGQQVDQVIQMADKRIDNSKTKEDLVHQIDQLLT